jgi:hypothetical protein
MTSATRNSTPPAGRIALLATVYAAAYVAAAGLDLGTTTLAIHAGASEGNVYATSAGAYVSARAWLTTLAAGAALMGFLLFGAFNAGRVAEIWLDRPFRSFGKFYVNPFARGVIDRAPLHMLSFALAFPALRVLAAVNNLMITAGMTPPLGRLISFVAERTSPAVGFWAVMAPLFYLFAFLAAPAAARVIRWLRRGSAHTAALIAKNA